VGYNVQTAVDAKHHLIVDHEVTNVGSDRDQLTSMAIQARDAMEVQDLTAIADRGYYKSEEIQASHEAGITVYVAKTVTSGATADGRFGKDDFIYDAQRDEYQCPAGEILTRHSKMNANGLSYQRYWSSNCNSCAMKPQCTPGQERRVTRWEHEELLDAMQERLDHSPDIMRIRRQTVEHPFGTIKFWMGAAHFLTTTLENVSTEMSLHVLAYNMKRVMKIMGTTGLMEAMKA
jgi:hypothetical protein